MNPISARQPLKTAMKLTQATQCEQDGSLCRILRTYSKAPIGLYTTSKRTI